MIINRLNVPKTFLIYSIIYTLSETFSGLLFQSVIIIVFKDETPQNFLKWFTLFRNKVISFGDLELLLLLLLSIVICIGLYQTETDGQTRVRDEEKKGIET